MTSQTCAYSNRQTLMLTISMAITQHFRFARDRESRTSSNSQQLLKNYFSFQLPSETHSPNSYQNNPFFFQNSHHTVLIQILSWCNWQGSIYFMLHFWEQIGRYLVFPKSRKQSLCVFKSKLQCFPCIFSTLDFNVHVYALYWEVQCFFPYTLWNKMT